MNTSKERLAPWALSLVVLSVYVAFPTRSYYWDGIYFAQAIEESGSLNASLLHPNHLFYEAFGYLAYRCALGLGFGVRAIAVLQFANGVLGALCACVLFYILKVSFRSAYLAAVLTLLFSFSATWWKFATDADAYVPSVLFLLAAFYLVLPGRGPRPFLVALVHAAGMFFHQLAVFFFPVAALGIFLQASGLPPRERLWRAAQYALTAFLVTFLTFYLCFYLQARTADFGGFVRWLTSYSPEVGFVFDAGKSLEHTVRGHFRLFFGGRFNFFSEVINPFTVALAGILIFACAALVAQGVRHRRVGGVAPAGEPEARAPRKQLAALCATWAAAYLVFLFFWIPQNTFYRLFYFPALVVLAGILLKRYGTPGVRRWRAALLVVVVALSNFLFLIYPYARVRKNTPLSLALEMNRVWSPRTVVYIGFRNTDNALLKYFNPSAVWKQLEPAAGGAEFEDELRRIYAGGGTAWLETSAVYQITRREGGAQWLAAHSTEQSQYRLTDPAYDMRLVQIFPRAPDASAAGAPNNVARPRAL